MVDPAFEAGVGRLTAVVVEAAAEGRGSWVAEQEAGLRAALELLAADPSLARLLLVDAAAAGGELRAAYERDLERLARALRRRGNADAGTTDEASLERARLRAAGLVIYLAGRVLAGEAEHLPRVHQTLMRYLLAPSAPAVEAVAEVRRAARA